MAGLGKMDPEERKAAGAGLNALKDEIDAALRARKVALGDAALDERLKIGMAGRDPAGRPRPRGRSIRCRR
jgi:phenylalanyl-tRNA synthetase alpha chain